MHKIHSIYDYLLWCMMETINYNYLSLNNPWKSKMVTQMFTIVWENDRKITTIVAKLEIWLITWVIWKVHCRIKLSCENNNRLPFPGCTCLLAVPKTVHTPTTTCTFKVNITINSASWTWVFCRCFMGTMFWGGLIVRILQIV